MKTLLLGLSLCLAAITTWSAAPQTDEPTGIRFFTGSWKEVLAEAKRQNKPVFVDIYTTWCGPCKMMAKQAFPDAKVGEKFNANFVNYQIDAEKGEGVEVAKKYAVDGYPTSLYVSANGDLIHRAIGYGGIEGMLSEADKAIEAAKDPKSLDVWQAEYKSGKRDSEFLYGYLQKLASVQMMDEKVVEEYIKTVPKTELLSEKNARLYSSTLASVNSDDYAYLVKEIARLRQLPATRQIGADVFSGLQQVISNNWEQAKAKKDVLLMEQVVIANNKAVQAFRPDLPMASLERQSNAMRMGFYSATGMFDKYRILAAAEAKRLMSTSVESIRKNDEDSFKRFEASQSDSVKNSDEYKEKAESMKAAEAQQTAMQLNNLAWSYFENFTNKDDLNQALTWSGRSLELDRRAIYLDTYAHLLYKIGRKAEAVKVQQEAISAEKKAGNDTTALEKALAKMK